MVFFIKKLLPVLLLGALSGFLNGLFGTGGGIPLVLVLGLLFGKKVADGKRFFTTALTVTLVLSLYSLSKYRISLASGSYLLAAVAAAMGGSVGALLLSRIPTNLLRRIFSAVILLSGILTVM